MATFGVGGGATKATTSTRDLFVRNATGLVRSWATFDAFIYSFFSINLVTLGWWIFSFGPITQGNGNLVTAIVISSILMLAEVVIYAGLIAVMPRAGGDYVWQTRVLGGGLGFVLAITGWVFTLWLWVPIYGNILAVEFISPLCAILAATTGNHTFVTWAENATSNNGYMVASVVVAGFAALVIAAGMKVYARVQKFCFFGGMLGLLSMFVVLLVSDHNAFVSGFNHFATTVFGVKGNAYAQTVAAAAKAGFKPVPFTSAALGPSMALIPLVLFFNLWPNWGATLYGEVRGAGDFRRNLRAMSLSVVATAILALVSLALIAKVATSTFYNDANFAFWSSKAVLPVWPYPGLLAAFLTTNPILQLWLVLSLSLWFWGWCGTVFLSSTRVIFAGAFDRVLPEWAAAVTPNGVPINALLAMVVPGLMLSVLYCYNIVGFRTATLDATLVIAITFLGSTVVAILLPWRQKRIYEGSPVARYKIAGVPLITVAGVIFLAFLVWNLWAWFTNAAYGVNNPISLWFIAALYLIALAIYAGSRLYRSRHGINLSAIHQEIPIE
ncbi:MAG TPA: APC family permease [Chloroflexota bacterium]|nr:APC family permease [Chloroflexota bacterium]